MDPFKADANYFLVEWEGFKSDPRRAAALLGSASPMRVDRVLDVGCGCGQEMLPFVSSGAIGIGMDPNPEAVLTGRRMYAIEELTDRVSFLIATGDKMPFADASFDVLICRIALMYMDNKAALAEMGRISRPKSILFVKYHAPAFYFRKLLDGLRDGNFRSSIHACRVLVAGVLYQITGKQFWGRWTAGGEIFQTRSTLQRELGEVGFHLCAELPDSNLQTPSYVAAKG